MDRVSIVPHAILSFSCVGMAHDSCTMFLILAPAALICGAVRPIVCAKAFLHVVHVVAIVDVSVGEHKYAVAVLFIILEFASVGISAWKSDCAVPVHLVLPPVAFVVAPLRVLHGPVPMPLTIHLISLVRRLRHPAKNLHWPREFARLLAHCHRLMDGL